MTREAMEKMLDGISSFATGDQHDYEEKALEQTDPTRESYEAAGVARAYLDHEAMICKLEAALRELVELHDHIKVCEKHPMRKLEADNAKLRKALVGLVGADTKAELEGMEAAIRVLPVPDEDRMSTINAIHALRDTLAP